LSLAARLSLACPAAGPSNARWFILSGMDDERARELLARERSRIERTLGGVTRSAGEEAVDPLDADDAGRDLFEEEVDEGVAERLRDELDAVARAERRLADGVYGISIASGKPIPDARLEAIPWAERTAEEQAGHQPGD